MSLAFAVRAIGIAIGVYGLTLALIKDQTWDGYVVAVLLFCVGLALFVLSNKL